MRESKNFSGVSATPWLKGGVVLALALVLLSMPLYVDAAGLALGFSICAAAVGAIGLNLLTGTTGLLSLGHAFFLAAGALTYTFVSGVSFESTEGQVYGLGLPPIVGMIAGVVVAGIAGLIFSPVASRLRGIYLGIASLALVFVGQHVLNTAVPLSGGFNGRPVPAFEIFGLSFSNDSGIVLFGVPYGRAEMQWYLGLVVLFIAWWFARNIVNSRSGRAMKIVAESELAASVMGVKVNAYKGKAFFLSSIYAGMAGVLFGLSIGSVAPAAFTIELSTQYLVMIVLGGLGSVSGSIAGAAIVVALPVLLQQYASGVPFLAVDNWLNPSTLAKYIYGLAVILVLLLKPAGIAGMAKDTTAWFRRRLTARGAPPARTDGAELSSAGDGTGVGDDAGAGAGKRSNSHEETAQPPQR